MTAQDRLVWLLDAGNPSARYLTLTGPLGCPAGDPEVIATRLDILRWQPVQAILDAQWPAGYWVGPGVGHSPKYKATIWQVVFLAALGAPRTGAIDRACAYVLDQARLDDGRFSAYAQTSAAPGHAARGATACLNGNLLRAFAQLGNDDPRIEGSREALARMVLRNGFCCRFNVAGKAPAPMSAGLPCAWGAIKALAAFAAVPAAKRTAVMDTAAATGIDFLLGTGGVQDSARRLASGDYPLTGACNRAWQSFGFPPDDTSDLLEALDILGELGLGRDPRLSAAIDVVRGQQDRSGRWALDHTPDNMWTKLGSVGEPNPWITLRAMHVLARWDGRRERTDEDRDSV